MKTVNYRYPLSASATGKAPLRIASTVHQRLQAPRASRLNDDRSPRITGTLAAGQVSRSWGLALKAARTIATPGDGCLYETAIRHVGGKALDMTSVKQGRHAAGGNEV
jgi:hypothetical protein